ncbi:ABC transporter substrate-binding protein [Bradyrhizobium sp. 83002]|uniref:ABC transporter substrate-binding protein n=1 Tax=Bradyrhizobium aeschynomenes TaxID=2734909 RepID=UPI0015547229|nr:ABC transporter substrate-binding protein [Bradyrhizobium aeschynomenes]NPU14956.1 ABC transporter substrate-binding protein [Bradyrhizobium aeschynomenes]NPV24458.1 ABC transporter substrate-binding protein [Bradyrhizobium aeschynomenes]
MKRHRALLRQVLAGAVLCLAATLPATSARADTVLKVKPSGDLKVLDPTIAADSIARNFGYMIYDTLFTVDDKLQVKPQMVDSWTTSADRKIWTFKLRDGLKFGDGASVTSEDVVASLKRWSQADAMGQMLNAHGASWEVVDTKTFTLTLKEPWGFVLDALAKPGAPVPFIVPAKVIASTAVGQPLADQTGSGPFIFKKDEWVPGSKLVFVKNPHYVPRTEPAAGLAGGKVVKFDRVEWLIIPDQQTALDALKKGELDIAEDIPTDLVPVAKAGKNVVVSNQDEIGVAQQIRLNSIQPPFDNPAIRRAALLAVNPQDYIEAWGGGKGGLIKACKSFYICASPYYTEAGFPSFDLEKAKTLLRESGYDGTPVVILDASENAQIHPASLVAEQQLKAAGFKVDVQAMDWATVVSRRTKKEPVGQGGWSIFISGPGGLDMMLPISHLGLRSNCDKAWFGWPCDAEIEKLRGAFGDSADMAERKALAGQIQQRAVQTVPYIPIAVAYQFRAARSDLIGILNPPAPVYWNVSRK